MNTREFIEKLNNDAELAKKFEGVNQPEKFHEIASQNGLTDDLETMKATALEMYKEQSEDGEIDLNKLSEIAGGDVDWEGSAIAASIGSATCAIGWALSL